MEALAQSTSDISMSAASQRWLRMGPWYAMFPFDFALQAIQEHTQPGDAVLDPFMGRGTTLVAAAALGRHGVGVEINSIAWLYAQTKLNPASKNLVLKRLAEIDDLSKSTIIHPMPEFFSWAFSTEILKFLLTARTYLDWKKSRTDRTLMAFILVDLHGKEQASLSNQMRQTKSMAPDYAVRWWKDQSMVPRTKNAVQILKQKIDWRYRHGLPKFQVETKAIHGDSSRELKKTRFIEPFKLLLTSPPILESSTIIMTSGYVVGFWEGTNIQLHQEEIGKIGLIIKSITTICFQRFSLPLRHYCVMTLEY